MAKSVEEKVEEYFKAQLDELKIRHYGKTEMINRSIKNALKNADSKSGNSGNNYPDIKLLLENRSRKRISCLTKEQLCDSIYFFANQSSKKGTLYQIPEKRR